MDDHYKKQSPDDKSARQKFLKYFAFSCILGISIYTLYPSAPISSASEVVSLVGNGESCDMGQRCMDYRGNQSKTKSGKTCKQWNDLKGAYAYSNWPSGLLTKNYCRNPDVQREIKYLDLQLAEAKRCMKQPRSVRRANPCDVVPAIESAKEKFEALIPGSTGAGNTIWCYVENDDPNTDPWEYCEPLDTTSTEQKDLPAIRNTVNKIQTEQSQTGPSTVCNVEFTMIQLNKHNEYRRLHGVPDLEFNEEACRYAQYWSEHQNSVQKMYHSEIDQRNGCGENLASGFSGFSAQDIGTMPTDLWYNEINDYCWANPGFSMATGHFTAMIWKKTSSLGCGYSGGYVTCDMCEHPNTTGQYEENVPRLLYDKPDACGNLKSDGRDRTAPKNNRGGQGGFQIPEGWNEIPTKTDNGWSLPEGWVEIPSNGKNPFEVPQGWQQMPTNGENGWRNIPGGGKAFECPNKNGGGNGFSIPDGWQQMPYNRGNGLELLVNLQETPTGGIVSESPEMPSSGWQETPVGDASHNSAATTETSGETINTE